MAGEFILLFASISCVIIAINRYRTFLKHSVLLFYIYTHTHIHTNNLLLLLLSILIFFPFLFLYFLCLSIILLRFHSHLSFLFSLSLEFIFAFILCYMKLHLKSVNKSLVNGFNFFLSMSSAMKGNGHEKRLALNVCNKWKIVSFHLKYIKFGAKHLLRQFFVSNAFD